MTPALSSGARPPLDVVIPALDAAPCLEATVASLEPGRARGLVREVLLVDGGSADGTPELARSLGRPIPIPGAPAAGSTTTTPSR